MKKIILTIGILITIILILSSLNNTFVTEPRANQIRKDFKIETIKNEYRECNSKEEASYDSMWETSCSELEEGSNCTLPEDIAKTYTDILKEGKNVCLEVYKAELGAI
jgi:hypothetical protein